MRIWLVAICMVTLTAVAAAQQTNSTDTTSMEEDTSEERKKKQGMAQAYMAFMMFKTILGSFFNAISGIIQVKSFGLSVIGTLINLGRFLLQLKSQMDSHGAGNSSGSFLGGSNAYRRVATPEPPYHWRPPPAYLNQYNS